MKIGLLVFSLFFISVSTAFADFKIIDAGDDERNFVYRVDLKTGEAWWTTGERWVKIEDSKPIPQSDYQFVPTINKLSVGLFRLDRVTGKGWRKSGNEWRPIPD